MQPDALVFDLDGTLIDSAADLALTLNLLLAEYNRADLSLDAVRAMIGDGIGALVARGFAATGDNLSDGAHREAAKRFLAIYTDPIRQHLAHPYPGVVETLSAFAARRLPMGVCTNKAQVATEMVLREAGLMDFFAIVIGHDRAPRPKPDASHVQAVCEGLGNPRAAVMVGDSRNDLAAGRSAGLPVILVEYGYGRPDALADADRTVARFSELPDVIAAL